MSLFNFQEGCGSCENTCEDCLQIKLALQSVLNANSKEELDKVLADLYFEGKNKGYRDALKDDRK